MARTMTTGYGSGLATASGMAIGSMLYVLATAFGLAAVFTFFPTSYLILKLAGAAYLIYLGSVTLIHSGETIGTKPKLRTYNNAQIFRQGIIVELTNPKTALFFIAFLPQFVDPVSGNVVLQLILLGMIYSLIAFSSDLLVIFISAQLGKWLSSHPAFTLWQDRISGAILISLGSYIALQQITQ
jgi:threonine/homoserine/homoserine lactone efflux protein